MPDSSDEILRTYIENVLRVQQESDRTALSDKELEQVALDAGMTDADLALVRQRIDDCLNRGNGFIRYRNWNDAIQELEQARALAPNNVTALNALATAYAGRWQNAGNKADAEHARSAAERVLQIDSRNDTALRIVSALQTRQTDLLAKEVGTPPQSGSNRRARLIAVLIAVAAIVVMVIALSSGGGPKPQPRTISQPTPQTPPPAPLPRKPRYDPVATPAAAGIADVLLTFGREGTGAGLFTDARAIAVDGAGQVYVAEYSSGRVQVFDSLGNFLRQWTIGEDVYVQGLAVGRTGTVFVAHSGRISRYDGVTGKPLGDLRYSGGPGFVSVSMTADGGLVAGWDGLWRGGLMINPVSNENVVVFDASMKAVRTIRHPISSISRGVVFHPKAAADGLGNVYVIDESGSAIYHFNPQGKYVDKFGSATDESGAAGGAEGIAVDGRGRVFVTGFRGVREFDGEGRYLGSIQISGSADAIAFNNRDELYAVARTRVTKFTMPK
ncbi:MAG: pknD 3 [Chlorobi bacterium]|nr:pknD 3 [Chlorobiota bacterium]